MKDVHLRHSSLSTYECDAVDNNCGGLPVIFNTHEATSIQLCMQLLTAHHKHPESTAVSE